MTRTPVNPVLIRWMRERSQFALEDLITKFRELSDAH